MNTRKFCENCGTALELDAPGGMCGACLMKVAMATETAGGTAEGGTHGFTPPTPEELAGRFPGLEILELIGRGGMGAVYKARQKELDRIIALKILPPDIGRDASFAERFGREAKALAKLNHPGIITIYDFGRADGLYFFLMEFVDGVTLGQLLQYGRVAPREALAIVPQICDALQYAHDQGIVHRDIKPANILLDRRGRVKVADFGLAKLIDAEEKELPGTTQASSELTETGKVVGTPNYMAPEQLSRPREVDHRADIYSLGVVFYQMLTGDLPGKTLQPPSRKVQVDVRLDEIVLRALEQQPERRYQQASVLKTQVETIAGEASGQVPPASPDAAASFASASPRLSRTAVAGFCCSLVALLPSILSLFISTHFVNGSFPGRLGMLIVLPLVLLTLACFVSGTILGAVAIGRIGRSQGKLYGFGLALASALLFPLLVLDALFVRIGVRLGLGVPEELIIALVLDTLLFWWAWRLLARRSARGEPLHQARRRFGPWFFAIMAACVILGVPLLNLLVYFSAKRAPTETEHLADSPHLLRKAPNGEVIRAAIAEPDQAWAWLELRQRAQFGRLNSAEADDLLDQFTAKLSKDYPSGYDKPLPWFDELSKQLYDRGLVSESHVLPFLQALHVPAIEPLPRLRETDRHLGVTCRWRNEWSRKFFGLVLLNEMRSVSLDAQPLTDSSSMRQWNSDRFIGNFQLPALSPGDYTVKCQIETALIPEADLTGLPPGTVSSNWPPAKRRWTRQAEAKLKVFSADAQLVTLTNNPALDPIHFGGLAVSRILVRSRGEETTAVVVINLQGDFIVPISFDAVLKVAGENYPLGAVWCQHSRTRRTYSGNELTVQIPPLEPGIKEADVILDPNPRHIEHLPSVNRIWGKRVVFTDVPLTRQDLR